MRRNRLAMSRSIARVQGRGTRRNEKQFASKLACQLAVMLACCFFTSRPGLACYLPRKLGRSAISRSIAVCTNSATVMSYSVARMCRSRRFDSGNRIVS